MSHLGKQFYEKGITYEASGKIPEAFDAFRKSAKANPYAAAPYIGLARIMSRNHQRSDAIKCLKKAVSCEPKNAEIKSILARTLAETSKLDESRLVYQLALDNDPHSLSAMQGLAALSEDMGLRNDAVSLYQKILSLYPDNSDALVGLLSVAKGDVLTTAISLAKNCLKKTDNRDTAIISYALGKVLSKTGENKAAMIAWKQANNARQATAGIFNREAFDHRINELIDIFSASYFNERHFSGNDSEKPVFIVGLPRSGTTLTEQILAGHSDIFGAGELDVLTDLATGIPDRLRNSTSAWPKVCKELNQEKFELIAQDHLLRLASIAPADSLRVIDKQPLNFWHLGLIATTLPNARIIHCRRDIRDCGLSIFAENFTPQQRWSTSLDDIVYYWQGYQRLMAHWLKVSGLQIIEVDYENVIEDLPGQSKRLLEFLGLPWDDSVLAFHETERAVQTPSRWQVRKPLYPTSKGRWQVHEQDIQVLIAAAKNQL